MANELMRLGDFDPIDIGVVITHFTDEATSPEDVERVRARLAAQGSLMTSATARR